VARYKDILETIGNTPELRINKLFDPRVEGLGQARTAEPGRLDQGPHRALDDRRRREARRPPARQHHRRADFGATPAWAWRSSPRSRANKLILVMPESFSVERRKLMAAYGASFELTPRELGMKGAIAKAREIVASTPNAWLPMQFDNPANLEVHKRTTAEEIARDFPDGLDYIFAGVGHGRPCHGRSARSCGRAAQSSRSLPWNRNSRPC